MGKKRRREQLRRFVFSERKCTCRLSYSTGSFSAFSSSSTRTNLSTNFSSIVAPTASFVIKPSNQSANLSATKSPNTPRGVQDREGPRSTTTTWEVEGMRREQRKSSNLIRRVRAQVSAARVSDRGGGSSIVRVEKSAREARREEEAGGEGKRRERGRGIDWPSLSVLDLVGGLERDMTH